VGARCGRISLRRTRPGSSGQRLDRIREGVHRAQRCALRPSRTTDRFEALVATSGLPPIRLHDLRHQAAVLALAAGTDMKAIQDMLGHVSRSVTNDLYATVPPELAIGAAEASLELVNKARRGTRGQARAQANSGNRTTRRAMSSP
jgi:integrase